MEKNMKCTVLVTSCDAYKDVLYNFEFLFKKFWSDCPFPVYLNIDKEVDTTMPYDNIIISDYKQNLVRMRAVEIKTPYVIMMQDDHFLFDKVDNSKILKCIEFAEKYDCGNLRLIQDPPTEDVFSESENLLEYKKGKAYRISARGGLWNAEYFRNYIDNFEDLWQMERHGQELSNKLDKKILCTKYRTLPIIDAVHKGMYEDFASILMEANELETQRPVMPSKVKAKEAIKGAIIDWNPELITSIQARLNVGFKPKYNKD